MAEFKLGRIKFVYQGAWQTGQSYVVDDVITVGGKTYICVLSHSSSSLFATDLGHNPSYWNIMADGLSWRADWAATTYYNKGDLVKYGGIVYQCNTAHTSATNISPTYLGLEQDQAKWDAFATSFYWAGAWTTTQKYRVRDFVSYGGYTYVCKTAHISAATASLGLENDQSKWDTFNAGVNYLGTWSGSTVRYKLNDVVTYGADLWICTTQHTSSASFDQTNWSVFVSGLQFENSWDQASTYQIGDVVTYGGYSYIASQNNSNQIPSSAPSYWNVYTTGFNFQGDYLNSTSYKVGQVVRLGGFVYVCTADTVGNAPPNTSYWARLASGIKWNPSTQTYTGVAATNVSSSGSSAQFSITRQGTVYTASVTTAGTAYAINDTLKVLGSNLSGISPANDVILTVTGVTAGGITSVSTSGSSTTWSTSVAYVQGDVVFWGASSYICVSAHVASSGNRPDADITATYWNLLANGTDVATLTTLGDTFYYGANGAQRLPIGTDGQVLRVNAAGVPAWAYYGQINNLVWVAPSGVDALANGQGTTLDKPWKTVKYAAQQIDRGYLNTSAYTLLAKNKQFLMKEINNYVAYTYKVSVTGTSAGAFTTAATAGLRVNMPITFTAQTGSLTIGGSSFTSATTYYVKAITTNTSFTISTTQAGGIAGSAATAAGTGTATAVYAYSTSKTERDAGYMVDALIFDLGHGGTSKTVANVLAYYNASGTTYTTNVGAYEITEFTEALAYMKTLVANILANSAPTSNYQSLNSVATASQSTQIIDVSLTAESGTTTVAQSLIDIVRNGLNAGNTTSIAPAVQPTTTIRVATGTFNETLPISIPTYTAVVGDELRTTVIQPSSANAYLVNDKPRSVNALNRLKSIVPAIMTNTPVVATTGNTATQQYLFNTGLDAASSSVAVNITTMTNIISTGLSAVPATYTLPTPTGGTGNASDAGYFNAARLILANKSFIQAEVTAYMIANYNSLWISLGTTGQASCTRDVGYIIDAVNFDVTYGGNLGTVIAARSYYSNGTFTEAAGEKTAAIAVQTRLAAIIPYIAQGLTAGWTKTSGNAASQITSGTAGSSAAGTFAAARFTEVASTINTGTTPTTIAPDITWASTTLRTANTNIRTYTSAIQANTIAWINDTYRDFYYNADTCSRDLGYIIDALAYDMLFGSNFLSCWNAMSYYRAITSTQVVITGQLQQTLGSIAFLGGAVRDITSGTYGTTGSITAVNRALSASHTIYDVFANGISSLPDYQLPDPTGYNSTLTDTAYGATSNLTGSTLNYGDGRTLIVSNYQFLKDEISAYLNTNYNAIWVALGATGQAKCQRDVGYLTDALIYDMTYGGNTQSLIAGSSYYSYYQLTIAATEKAATIAAYGRLKTVIGQIVTATSVTRSSGNVTVQVTSGTAGSTGASNFAQARIQDVNDWINNGYANATIAPATSWVSPGLVAANTTLQSRRSEVQSDVSAWVKKFYQTLNFTVATCQRDVGYMVDAIGYDIMFGSNFASIVAGMSYYRATASAAVVTSNQYDAQLGAITFLKYKVKTILATGATAQVESNVNDLIGYIYGGGVPRFRWPDPSNINSGYAAAKMALYDNLAFLQAEAVTYINVNYSSVVYSKAVCKRDIGYIIDALRYDLTYGGNFASVQAGKKYYSALTNAFEIASSEKAATLAVYGYLSTLAQAVAQNNTVASPLQTSVAQVKTKGTQTVGSSAAATQIGALMTIITNIVNNGTTSGVPTLTITAIATANTFTSNGHGLAVGDLITAQSTSNGLVSGTVYYVQSFTTNTFTLSATYGGAAIATFTNGSGLSLVVEKTNLPSITWVDSTLQAQYVALQSAKATIQAAVITYIGTNYPTLTYDSATCSRDVGYIIDSVAYDFMFNSNYRSVIAGRTYYSAQAALVITGQKAATLDAMAYLQTQIVATTYASTTAISRANSLMLQIIKIINQGIGAATSTQETPEFTGTLTYNNNLQLVNSSEILRANSNFIAAELAAYTSVTYSATVTNTTVNTNIITTSSAHNLVVGDPVQFTATTVNTTATQTIVSSDGSRPNQIVVGTTAGMVVNMPISFTGTTFGNPNPSTVYYIKSIVDSTHITICDISGGTVKALTGATGSMGVIAGGLFGNLVAGTVYWVLTAPSTTTFTVSDRTQTTSTPFALVTASGVATSTYYYDPVKCKRDTAEIVLALVNDLQYTGTYKTLMAGKYYNNAVSGSQLQDMFWVRNATGLRNCTLSGLSGSMTATNSYGTKRPTAGGYTALDPGFGPNDSNVWINSRSHYSQNVTMFGTGCSGAKIDAALHAGGNKSMVKNDYTTIISDGIGVWVTGSGALTELVSVFNYYGYAGYMAELGARIRATNGNSSYGTYGVVAEGVDTFETPLYATMNNRYFQAQITNTVTDANNKILRLEYGNAGTNYTNSVVTINGSGYNATAVHDEFRDAATFETRLIDLNDGNGYGGTSYVSFSNAAQSGDRYSITIAATDTSLSSAYVGMRIQVTAGTGVGQYANIYSYNNGSKIAQVFKDSVPTLTITATTTGTPGFATVASTTSLYANMPFYVGTAVGGLSTNTVYFVRAVLGATTFSVTTSSGGTTDPISASTTAQTVTFYPAGWDHTVSGTTIPAALDLTTTYVIEPRINYSAPGYATASTTMPTIAASVSIAATGTSGQNTISVASSNSIAIGQAVSGTNIGTSAYVTGISGAGPYTITLSVNNSGAVASSVTFTGVYGAMAYGSGSYMTVATGGQAAAYSSNGKTWTAVASALPSVRSWSQLVYAGGESATATVTVGGFGGSGAILTAVLGTAGNAVAGADQVASVTIVNGGTGYTTPPTIVFTAVSGGSGATGTAIVLNGAIVGVTMSIPGSGYTVAPTVSARTDIVTVFNPVSWGRNYTVPTVAVSDPFTGTAWSSGGSAVQSTIYFYINSNIKNWYTCTGAGTFTTTGPIHTTGSASNGTATLQYIGTTAAGNAVLTNGGVSSITLVNGGYGYSAVPAVTITETAGLFVAISNTSTDSATVAATNVGGTWTAGGALPASTMAGLTYGNSILVAVGGTAQGATSTNGGVSWTGRTLPTLGSGTYIRVVYGAGTFVAVATTGVTATSTNGITWVAGGTIPGSLTNITDLTYGNGRFVAIAGGQFGAVSTVAAYSIDNGVTWTASAQGLTISQNWTRIRYGQGLFFAVASGSAIGASSPDGVVWTQRAMPATSNWSALIFGNPSKQPLWAAVSNTNGTVGGTLRTGAQSTGRMKVASGVVTEVRMLEPGSGYPKGNVTSIAASNVINVDNTDLLVDGQPVEFTSLDSYGLVTNTTYYVIGSTIVAGTSFKVGTLATPTTPVTVTAGAYTGYWRAGPIVTVTDPNKVKTAALRVRMGDGALGNPSFTNRGLNNTTASSTTQGDGYGDFYQPSNFVNVGGLYAAPTPGANVEFANIPNTWFKLVAVTNILGSPGNYTAQFQINPSLSVYNAPAHGVAITTRLKYSQVRLTGHDFLYIGTGNRTKTNYPYVDPTTASQANQSLSSGGGRVFFTSTDQDGNFNVGNLFGVQQATGTATLNASAFNLAGLQSLQLGAVSLGIGSAVITQFSTDPYFTANSDSIVPTQRAIRAYITAQIGGGSSSLNVNTLTAGVVYLANNTISTTTGVQINVTSKMNFTGGIDGAPVALGFFLQR